MARTIEVAGASRATDTRETAGARTVLRTKIAEIDEVHRQRLVPLVEEQAAVEQLAYD